MMATVCRIEYWTGRGWQVNHSGFGLLDPQAYVDKTTARTPHTVRAVELFTGTVYAPEGWELF